MTKKQFALLFLIILAGTTVYEFSLSDQYGGLGACGGADLYFVTATLHPSFYAVGSPWFSVPQLVVLPGSTATVTVFYYNFGGNNITQILTLGNLYYGPGTVSTQPEVSLGYFAQTQQPSPGSTGVAITHSAITYFSNDTASQTFTISVARDVPWATYAIGDVGCPVGGGYLLTVGYIPYWQSVFWISQLAEVIGILVITCLLTLAAVVSINLIQRARSGK